MSTPIISNITKENMINKSPMIAEVNCSVAALTASGFPAERIYLYPESIIKIRAIPPEIPRTAPKISPTNSAGSVFISPIAVATAVHLPSSRSAQGAPAYALGKEKLKAKRTKMLKAKTKTFLTFLS